MGTSVSPSLHRCWNHFPDSDMPGRSSMKAGLPKLPPKVTCRWAPEAGSCSWLLPKRSWGLEPNVMPCDAIRYETLDRNWPMLQSRKVGCHPPFTDGLRRKAVAIWSPFAPPVKASPPFECSQPNVESPSLFSANGEAIHELTTSIPKLWVSKFDKTSVKQSPQSHTLQ